MQITQASVAVKPAAAQSPFRYPGGKAWLADFLREKLLEIAPEGGTYAEPYAGGAGAAIKLLASGAATEIYLNDRDPRVYCAWQSILNENDRFREKLADVVPNIEQWWACKAIVDEPWKAEDRFELGFSTFFLNRTNRSGILQGAAPIGGYEQLGDWKLDARFYRQTLLDRIAWLGEQAARIHVSRLDGLAFLKRMATKADNQTSLFFVDPPYVEMGSRLYMNAMAESDHQGLAKFLCSGKLKNWIVTYDDSPSVHHWYSSEHVGTQDVRYSLHRKRNEREILIMPKGNLPGGRPQAQ